MDWLNYNMGSRMFLLLVLVLLVFTDHSHGVPETHAESLVVSKFTDASIVGEPRTTAHPVNAPRQHTRLCNCEGESDIIKGKGRDVVNKRCVCQQFGRRNVKYGKMKTLCQRKKNKNLKRCSRFSKRRREEEPKKGGNTRKYAPSVPI